MTSLVRIPPRACGAPLPLEVAGRMTPGQLELQVLDRQVGGADGDEAIRRGRRGC